MQDEDEEENEDLLGFEPEVEVPNTREQPGECSDVHLSTLAHKAGMSCQHLFVRSYLQAGQSDSYARAVFARYLVAPQESRALPKAVQTYGKQIAKKARVNGHHIKRGFCSGCMLTQKGIEGMAYAYSLIHPESLAHDLQSKPEKVSEYVLVERLYDNLIVSGALDEKGHDLDRDEYDAPQYGE